LFYLGIDNSLKTKLLVVTFYVLILLNYINQKKPKPMIIKFKLALMIVVMSLISNLASAQYKVHTEDLTNFWEAYDSIQKTIDKAKQIDILQRLYVDRGTQGLKYFMESRGGKPEIWQKLIEQEKKRFETIRPYTLSVLDQKAEIDKGLEKFKSLYPDFKDADVYFTIGIGNSGGTVYGQNVLIGCEVMANEEPDWAVQIVLHEFVHTQQSHETSGHVLSHSIHEGMADFISELTTNKSIADLYPGGHIAFAIKNEKELWELFKKYISSNDKYNYHGWLYGNGGITLNGINMNDLGYGMGYLICKRYYENASNKKEAIKTMLTLNLTDENARQFLLDSGFVPKKDIEFVKNFEFKPLEIELNKNIKKVVYGYKIKKNRVEFRINAKDIPFEVETLSVAGSFNNWNPKAEGFKMQKVKSYYVLSIPKSEFNQGNKYQFKFVANDNSWLQPPLEAENAVSDNSGNKNLVLQL
jgi:hypothetical protein